RRLHSRARPCAISRPHRWTMRTRSPARWLVRASWVAASAAILACSSQARAPEQYRDDTERLLVARERELTACYTDMLATHPDARGHVPLHYRVEARPGRVLPPTVAPARTAAPAELTTCVVRSLEGLRLVPPDPRDGEATFVWEFTRARAPD